MSLVTPSNTPLAPSATADATAPVASATKQGGFWNDIKNLPGQAINAVTKIPVVGKAIGTAMSWAGKPLQEIQKDYKFIHSLYADHGFGAGLVGTLGVVAGGVIGSLGGPEGTVIGADLAGTAVRNILGRAVPAYKTSFDKSNDPNYLVSFGRDLAHGLSNVPGFGALANTNTGVGQVVSGIADASFDFETDPLATFGKLKGAVKRGDYNALATETDAATGITKIKLDPDTGKPISRAALPNATSGQALQNFFAANSLVVHSADQVDAALANPLAANVNRAVNDIVDKAVNSPKTAAADIANTYGVKNGWSRAMSVALSKVSNADQVTQIFKQALYSKELADSSTEALGALKLPTRSVGKLLSEKVGPDRVKNSLQGSTFNDQVNLLLPRKSAVMEDVTDSAGNVLQQPKVDPVTGEQLFKINKPAIFAPGNAMNALAAKVRTFTGRRPLSFDKDEMALSAKQVDMSDPNLGQTIYDIAYLSMPHNVALERASAFMTAANDEDRLAMLHTLHQEVLKNFGIANAQAAPLFSQLKDASVGSEADHGVYGKLDGKDVGTVELKSEYGADPKSMAIVVGQRYKGAMLDLHDIRQQLRSAKAYGALYNPIDDSFTKYTNVIFAPLALLSPAFGLRVSTGEALHQVMRRGLGSYLSNVLAATTKNLDNKYKLYHNDTIAQGLSEADKDAIEAEQKTGVAKQVTETEVTKELQNRENIAKRAYDAANNAISSKSAWNNAVNRVSDARYSIMPAGWVAGKFLKSNLFSYLVKDKIKVMDEYQDVMGSRSPTAGVASSHSASQEMAAKDQIDMFTKTRGHGMVPGQELAGLTQFDPHMHDYWAKNVNMASMDKAQRDIARAYLNESKNPAFKNMSVDEQFASLVDGQAANIRNLNMYQDYRSTMDGYTKAVPESFAKAQIDYLHGIVKGANGVVNMDLVNKIAKGEQVTGKELRQLPSEQAPLSVLGRRVQPRMSDALRQVEEKGYRKFVNPVMDFVSRQPIFNDFYARRRLANQPLIDMGLLSRDEAVRLSALQATKEMIPAIHSPAIRSQFAVIHRNLLPFYFAQEQAIRRTGRLILTNPQAFRDFQIIQQGMNNPGFVHTDANGQKYIVYPGLGEFGNALSRGLNAIGLSQFQGLPTSITGNTASLLTVLPEIKMPGTSPFVNLALTQLSKKFPWMDKAVNIASGGYPSQNWIDTIIPNSTMRDFFNSMSMDDRESTVYNSKLSAIMSAYYHGDLPENFQSLPPFQQAQIMAKIENNAKSNLIIKGIFSFFLPLAPTVSNDVYDKNLQSLRSDYISLLKQKDPLTGQTYTAASALNEFLKETGSPTNPNRALAYTVARSENGTSGAYVPLADSTLNFINDNSFLLNNPSYSSAAPYLIPQVADGKDAMSVENKLILDHYRSKVTSQEFLTSLYVKQGWQDLAQDYTDYQTALTAARNQNNKQQEYQIGQIWKQVTSDYGQSNPVWFANYNNPTRAIDSAKVISQFQEMNTKNLIPNTPEGNGIKELLASYQDYHNGLIANTINGQHLPGYSNLVNSWYTYVDNLAITNPRLQSVISGVFRRAV